MLGRRKHVAKHRDQLNRLQPRNRKRLGIEPLEGRAMLSGVVDIQVAGGDLDLVGDGSNNQVELQQTNNPGEYFISSPDNTLFTINGAVATLPDATVNSVSDDIFVDLLDGNDSFSFLGVSPGVQSTTPDDLVITNSDGSNVNVINEVLVNGRLFVGKDSDSSGYSELRIVNSTVIGVTDIDNFGNGTGDTKTVIDNSHLQGEAGVSALVVVNGISALVVVNPNGQNLFDALGNSQFGTGNFVDTEPTVVIQNEGGGSRTTFTGANQIAGPGTTTIYGRLVIANGPNVPGTLNVTTFNRINVLGEVIVANEDGDTETVVIDSTLGNDFIPADGGGGTGDRFVVANDAGYDMFEMTDSLVPWGLVIVNDDSAGGGSRWGSDTQITGSTIVTHPPGSALPRPNHALIVTGDNGPDVINLVDATLGGALVAVLYDGNNDVAMLGSWLGGIILETGMGNDTVSIDNTQIISMIYIYLYDGADTLSIRNVDYATQWPNPLLTDIEIDADGGTDTFEGVVPPADLFAGFDFFP